MLSRQFSIYYLLDPVTLDTRYVGCSCRPFARFKKGHLRDKSETHKARWIRKLITNDLRPILVIKCVLQTQEEAYRMERALIAKLRANGEALTNETEGGEGICGLSLDANAKKSAAARKRYENPVEREAISLRSTLMWMDPEIRSQLEVSLAKSWDNPQRRQYISNAIKDSWNNPTTRNRRITGLQKPWSETRRAGQEGVKWSEARRVNQMSSDKRFHKHTQATKDAIAAHQLGGTRPEWTPERRAKIDAAWEAKRVAKQSEKDAQDILFGPEPLKQPKTRCPRGHEYNAQNRKKYQRPDGSFKEYCTECRREKDREKYAALTQEEKAIDLVKRQLYLTPEKKAENARKRKERDELRFEADQKAFALL